jgi:hypothetical protein
MDAISQSILITVVAFSMIGFILFLGWNSARTKAEEKRILEEERRTRIISKRNEWGDAICKAVYQRKVAIDMTEDMVLEAWGHPTSIDQKEITKKGVNKERWVYGVPRKGANYIYFKNGKVDKLKT